jgi:DNA-directed RNA polymerase subunit RPC12/RpoP
MPRPIQRRKPRRSIDPHIAEYEEVAIGAAARKAHRERILIGALGVAIIAASIWLYFWLMRPQSTQTVHLTEVMLQCGACGEERMMTVAVNATNPLTCPKCRDKEMRKLWQCRTCWRTFVPVGRGTVECPHCASKLVGSWERPPPIGPAVLPEPPKTTQPAR